MAAQILPGVPCSLSHLPGWIDHNEPGLSVQSPRQDGTTALPPLGFPPSIQGPMVWSREDKTSFGSQIVELSPFDVAEVEQAVKHFLGLGLDGSEVTRENFPLPVLGSRLDGCAAEIHQGRGLCIVRGLTPESYSAEDNVIMFLGLASYIGGQRGVQTSKGAMLTHVYESHSWVVPREKRHGIHTNGSLPFHTDMGCDILAIHIRNCAAEGGGTYVASVPAVYNAMMKANPRAVHDLAKHNWPVQVSIRGISPFVLAPLLGFQSGNLVMSADPARIGPHPAIAHGRIPDLLPVQKEALASLQQTAREMQVRLPTRQGDIAFINNWSVLHARGSYQDSDQATRHLIRLWLRNEKYSWEIPESMKTPWEASFGQKAKRIVNRQYPVAPMPEYMEPKFTNGSAAFVVDESDGDEDQL
ncbi:Clavaminate synthase-like protein [Xylaria nigripes]|nr:Clavaminate synthase-like protein [Xylaria nigripes]